MKKFAINVKDVKKFNNWVIAFASDTKYKKHREILKNESEVSEHQERLRSKSFLEEMHTVFPIMKGCSSDVSCLKYLFNAAINVEPKSEKKLAQMMLAINKILPLQFPSPSEMSSYTTSVTKYRNFIKASFGKEVQKKYYNNLLVAFGSNNPEDAGKIRLKKDEKQRDVLLYNLKHLIPVKESSIQGAIHKTKSLMSPIDALIFVCLMTGCRKSEAVNPEISDFAHEKCRDGWIVQWGVAKERSDDPDLFEEEEGPDAFAKRRRVEKPILDVQGITTHEVRKAVDKLREMWGVEEMLDKGLLNEDIASQHDKAVGERIRVLFPEAVEYAHMHRKQMISTHFMRKIYGVYSYVAMCNSSEQLLNAWLADFMGWKPSSALEISLYYSDVYVERDGVEGYEDHGYVSDDENLPLRKRVQYRRKELHRMYIDLRAADGSVVRIKFHKRGGKENNLKEAF